LVLSPSEIDSPDFREIFIINHRFRTNLLLILSIDEKEHRMSIEDELRLKLKNNQHAAFITDADDLLAAWRHGREKTSGSRCFDFSRVPKEYRLSAPPNERAALMPCIVTVRRQQSYTSKTIKPAPGYSTNSCHGHGRIVHLTTEDLDALDTVSFAKRNVAPYISPIMDAATLSLVCKDLGLTGKAMPKVINGRQYIAFSGYSGLRTIFPGTLYSVNHRKIVTMAIGALGIKKMVKSGGILTICLTVPLTILELFLKDQATLSAIAGTLATDILKIGASALIGAIAGLAAGAITTVAIVPIAVAIGVGTYVGHKLDKQDERYGITEKLITALEGMGDEMDKIAGQAGSALYRGTEGFLRSQGIRLPNY
jgi:hypothetical protein